MPVPETVAPIRPLKYYDSSNVKRGGPSTIITGVPGWPLFVRLHASGGRPGAISFGDLWQFWGDSTMGYQEGVQQAISVWETHSAAAWNVGGTGQLSLILAPCDTIWAPNGLASLETFWSGYEDTPLNAATTRRGTTRSPKPWRPGISSGPSPLTMPIRIASTAPPILNRINANGSTNTIVADNTVLMPDQTTTYSSHFDTVAYALANCASLPFAGFAVARQDTSWPGMWSSNVAMANALKSCHAGFVFSWNNGTHGDAIAALT